ncbi:asparagine-rich protein-like [Eurosta solidaginis]|uniref:asparagine-rich protein-like n=1 Tax=Eurosta solidaginis TaxID=178769 RepID=UPI003531797D
MRIIYRINLIKWVLILYGTLCRPTSAQVFYENDRCDSDTYRGFCLLSSKCTELPAIMHELGLKNTDVKHCGFAVFEEIICCPTRPKPGGTPHTDESTSTELSGTEIQDMLSSIDPKDDYNDQQATDKFDSPGSFEDITDGDVIERFTSNEGKSDEMSSEETRKHNRDPTEEEINKIYNIFRANPVFIGNSNDDEVQVNGTVPYQSTAPIDLPIQLKPASAQIYYEYDPCGFGKYNGTCLVASKCTELPAIMHELGFKSSDVANCGFALVEEIICCPTKPTPVQTPKELSNELTSLLKPFEFRPPLENETTTSSQDSETIKSWLANNFKQNVPTLISETGTSTFNSQPIGDNNEDTVISRIHETPNNYNEHGRTEVIGDDMMNNENVNNTDWTNFIFNVNFGLNQMPTEKNKVGNGGSAPLMVSDIAKDKNTTKQSNGKLIPPGYLSKVALTEDQLKPDQSDSADNDKKTQRNYSLIINQNDLQKVELTKAQMEQVNALFNQKPTLSGNFSNTINNINITNIHTHNLIPNGIPIEPNTLGMEDENAQWFIVDVDDSTISSNSGLENTELRFINNPVQNGIPIELKLCENQYINAKDDKQKSVSPKLTVKAQLCSNSNVMNTQNINAMPTKSAIYNSLPIENIFLPKEDVKEEEISRTKAKFNVNSVVDGNSNPENTLKLNLIKPNPFQIGIPIEENYSSNEQNNLSNQDIQTKSSHKMSGLFKIKKTKLNDNSNNENTAKNIESLNEADIQRTLLINMNASLEKQYHQTHLPRQHNQNKHGAPIELNKMVPLPFPSNNMFIGNPFLRSTRKHIKTKKQTNLHSGHQRKNIKRRFSSNLNRM